MGNRLNFLNKYSIISKVQNGYSSNKSTFDAMSDVNSNELEKENKCLGIVLDVAKTFDMVQHKRVPYKLEKIYTKKIEFTHV